MFSSVTGKLIDAEDCKSDYWKENMVSTVQFQAALEQALQCHPKANAIIEVGPHPALKGPTKEILQNVGTSNIEYFHSCSREADDFVSLLENVASMYTHSIPLNLVAVNQGTIKDANCTSQSPRVLNDLPPYKWNHATRFWAESRTSQNLRFRLFRRHQLLGSRSPDDIPTRPTWRNHLMLKEIPWLADFKVGRVTPVSALL